MRVGMGWQDEVTSHQVTLQLATQNDSFSQLLGEANPDGTKGTYQEHFFKILIY